MTKTKLYSLDRSPGERSGGKRNGCMRQNETLESGAAETLAVFLPFFLPPADGGGGAFFGDVGLTAFTLMGPGLTVGLCQNLAALRSSDVFPLQEEFSSSEPAHRLLGNVFCPCHVTCGMMQQHGNQPSTGEFTKAAGAALLC